MSLLVCVELLEVYTRPLGVLLLHVFVKGVVVPEYEVQLVVLPAFVWPKHDGIWCVVLEFLLK